MGQACAAARASRRIHSSRESSAAENAAREAGGSGNERRRSSKCLAGAAPARHLLDRLRSLPDPPASRAAFSAALDSLDEWMRLDARAAAQAWPIADARFEALHPGTKARRHVR